MSPNKNSQVTGPNTPAKPDYDKSPKTDEPKFTQELPTQHEDRREAETGPEFDTEARTSTPMAPASGPTFPGQQAGAATRAREKANKPPKAYQSTDGTVIYTLVDAGAGHIIGALEAEGPGVADYVDVPDVGVYRVSRSVGKAPVIFVTGPEGAVLNERELQPVAAFHGFQPETFRSAALSDMIAAVRAAKPDGDFKVAKAVKREDTDGQDRNVGIS